MKEGEPASSQRTAASEMAPESVSQINLGNVLVQKLQDLAKVVSYSATVCEELESKVICYSLASKVCAVA